MQSAQPSGKERFFDDDEIIVSKTNLKGHITYANDVFLKIADFRESDVLGKPHSILRHPDMPRAIFKLLWDTIQDGRELFAYIKNRTKNGDYYWVLAHATPSYDADGNICGFHSNRRVPDRQIVGEKIIPLYRQLRAEEERHANAREGMQASCQLLKDHLQKLGMGYDEYVHTL